MLVSDFHYDLPPDRIAQRPLPDRAASRLLHLHHERDAWEDRFFRDFPDLLRPDDLLVLNNTRVFPARLVGHRRPRIGKAVSPENPKAQPGRVEVLLIRPAQDDPNEWHCLVRPGRKIGLGEKLYFESPATAGANSPPALEAEVTARADFGERRIRFAPVPDFFARLDRIGRVPLPPYIHRDLENDDDHPDLNKIKGNNDRASDRERYQTVYAQTRGSVAAPTAGLHFTADILQRIRARGVEIAEVTLHIGLGTFQPVRVTNVEDHKLHRESYEISPQAAQAINQARAANRRVVAVGTTTVRTLENAASVAHSTTAALAPGQGEAEAFIYPGYRFRIVDALLTNFHLPQSTLLMLVSALGGKDLVMAAYRHAVAAGYRFYSYGDCMFIDACSSTDPPLIA